MRINAIRPVSFKGKIIDTHTHIGQWDKADGTAYTLKDVFEATSKTTETQDTVEKVIVSNLACLKNDQNAKPFMDEYEGNKQLLHACEENPKAFALAACEPKTGSVQKIEKLFEENPGKFIGLKIHPDESKIMASNDLINPYLRFAQSKNLPCLFHCGINYKLNSPDFVDPQYRFSTPAEVYKAAQKIPNTPVIMAHLGAGGEKVHNMAIDTLVDSIEKNTANLYADISWVDIDKTEKPSIINAIKRLRKTNKGDMTERLLFGSDAPIAEFSKNDSIYSKFIKEIKQAIRNDAELSKDSESIIEKIFYSNANKLFFHKDPAEKVDAAIETVAKKSPKTKALAILGGILIAGAGAAAYIKNLNAKKE